MVERNKGNVENSISYRGLKEELRDLQIRLSGVGELCRIDLSKVTPEGSFAFSEDAFVIRGTMINGVINVSGEALANSLELAPKHLEFQGRTRREGGELKNFASHYRAAIVGTRRCV